MRVAPNTARTMAAVARPTPRPILTPPSDDMLALLARVHAGAELVTAERKRRVNTVLVAEIDGLAVRPTVVRGLIRRGLIRVIGRTTRTKTWALTDAGTAALATPAATEAA